MLESILLAAGKRALAVGNVGVSVIDAVTDPHPYDVLAVEASSYQLHWSSTIRPAAGALLNLAPDHLDWHGSMTEYAQAKAAVWAGAVAVGNADDPLVAQRLPPKVQACFDEFVTCDCRTIVHAAYPAPAANDATLTGMKIRSGLKIVITLSTIRKKRAPSAPRRIFEVPVRCAATIGSNFTLYPAFMNAKVVVVGVEKPFGSRCRNSIRHSRRAARKPEVRSGMGRPARYPASQFSAAFPARRARPA